MPCSESVLLLQLLEEALDALVREVTAHPLDEFVHHAGPWVALGEDLAQAGAADHVGVELHARLLELLRHRGQILDRHGNVLDARTVMLDVLRDLRLGRRALQQHKGDGPRLHDRRDHRRHLAFGPPALVELKAEHLTVELDGFFEILDRNGNVVHRLGILAEKGQGLRWVAHQNALLRKFNLAPHGAGLRRFRRDIVYPASISWSDRYGSLNKE